MCGRYVANWSKTSFEKTFNTQAPLFESFNIAPTQLAPVVYSKPSGQRETLMTRWGLLPYWVKEPEDFKANLFNARAESLSEKASFKRPFKTSRCLVPASGFYEWKKENGGKVPHYIKASDDVIAFAGLYEHWQKGDNEVVSHTIITTKPNDFMQSIHNRMPVILEQEAFDLWLDPSNDDTEMLEHLLKPYEGELEAHPVDKRVGRPSENDSALVDKQE